MRQYLFESYVYEFPSKTFLDWLVASCFNKTALLKLVAGSVLDWLNLLCIPIASLELKGVTV
jgi:hypothetical protein